MAVYRGSRNVFHIQKLPSRIDNKFCKILFEFCVYYTVVYITTIGFSKVNSSTVYSNPMIKMNHFIEN